MAMQLFYHTVVAAGWHLVFKAEEPKFVQKDKAVGGVQMDAWVDELWEWEAPALLAEGSDV